MTPPILVAVDPRRDDPAPPALGLRLARLAGTPLLLAATYPSQPRDRLYPELAEALRTGAEAALSRAAAQLADARGSTPVIQVAAVPAESPSRALHELADETAALLTVIGSSSRGQLGRVSPGAVTDRLLHRAPCPVAVAPRGLALEAAGAPLRRVGVAYVDAPDGQAALEAGAAIARAAGAYLRLFVAMRPLDYYATARRASLGPETTLADLQTARREDAEAELRHGLDRSGDPSAAGEVLDGEPAAALAAASSDVDLLICGSRGFGPLRTLLLGGTSHALVRRAACSVLVVPRGTEETLSAAFREARMVA
jgi:nucleotide-binding universal stress UspA family protein